jgi:hypothetical protein
MEEVGLTSARETLADGASRRHNFLLSRIVPCFNEEAVIRLTCRRLVEVLAIGARFAGAIRPGPL